MLQYLIILLDDSSTSYCHYDSQRTNRLIGLSDLAEGIKFAMKENLMIQFVYPDFDLPTEYKKLIETIDHSKIMPSTSPLSYVADIIVFNNWTEFVGNTLTDKATCVLRITKEDLFAQKELVKLSISKFLRLNIVITNIESFTEADLQEYKNVISTFGDEVERLFRLGQTPQINVITDRIALTQMNNCNAGCNNITLAPDGNFYVCPAFYYSLEDDKTAFNIGNLQTGLKIKAANLYKLPYAPLCRNCDAYQCKRCVWINRKMTYDITTPSHEQCVLSHIERNESRRVLEAIKKEKDFYPEQVIPEIEYLDPYEVRVDWNKI